MIFRISYSYSQSQQKFYLERRRNSVVANMNVLDKIKMDCFLTLWLKMLFLNHAALIEQASACSREAKSMNSCIL